jgi:hypothetical protein
MWKCNEIVGQSCNTCQLALGAPELFGILLPFPSVEQNDAYLTGVLCKERSQGNACLSSDALLH